MKVVEEGSLRQVKGAGRRIFVYKRTAEKKTV